MTIGVRREILKGLKRVVIKVGSSIIAKRIKGKPGVANELNINGISLLAQTVLQIIDRGCEVVLVSSGAIMAGRERLDLHRAELSIPEKQACAAIGQSYLMHTYEKQFEKSFVDPLLFITNSIDWYIDDSYGTQTNLLDFFN